MIYINYKPPLNYIIRIMRNLVPVILIAIAVFIMLLNIEDWNLTLLAIFFPLFLISLILIGSMYRNRYYITYIEIDEANIKLGYFKFSNYFEFSSKISELNSYTKVIITKTTPIQWKLILNYGNIKIIQYPSHFFEISEWDSETIVEINNKINEIKRKIRKFND